MLILKCDWCGRTVSNTCIGVYTTQLKSLGLPSKSLEIISSGKHICESCMEKAGILMQQQQTSEESEPESKKPEAEPVTEEKPVAKPAAITRQPVKKEKPIIPQESASEDTDGDDEKTDIDKILALKKAGWRVKDIAGDMHLEPQRVSNILYQVKHNNPEKWKAVGLPI